MSTTPFRFGVGPAGLLGGVAENIETWSRLARRIEDLGYDSLLVGDHLDRRPGPISAMAVAAAATTRLHVGSSVLNNDLRDPTVLAQEAMTLHRWTSGRLELGLGAGWLSSDYAAAGLTMEPASVRIARLDAAIGTIRAAFSTVLAPESNASLASSPPLTIGGGGRRMLELAAREADIVAINARLATDTAGSSPGTDVTLAATRRKLEWVRRADRRRAEPELQIYVHAIVVSDDRSSAAARVGEQLGLSADEVLESPHALVGPVESMVEQLGQRRASLGISYVVVSAASAERFAPVVAALGGR